MLKTIITILALFVTTSAYASEQVFVLHNDYVVEGSNLSEIKQSIRERGFKSSGGMSFAAKTNYDIKWKPVFVEAKDSCQLKALYTAVEIEYSLPVLDASSALSKADKKGWSKYYKSLKEHEEGHGQLGIEAAKELKWQAMNLYGRSNCVELNQDIENLVQSILSKYRNKNLAYDRHTGHGHSQGAVLVAIR